MKATLSVRKKIAVIAGTVLILIVSLGFMFYNMTVNEMYTVHSAMSSTMTSFESKYQMAISLQEIAMEVDSETVKGSLYLIREIFEESGDVQDALDLLKSEYFDCYLIDASGEIHVAKNSEAPDLTQAQYDQLFNDGVLVVEVDGNNIYYYYTDTSYGKIITCNRQVAEMETNSALTGISERFEYFIAPVSSGIIDYSSVEELTGSPVPEELRPVPFNIDKNCQNKRAEYKFGMADLVTGGAYCLLYECEGYVYGLYYDNTEILIDTLNDMIAPAFVLIGSFIMALIFFFSLWKDSDEKESKWIKLFNRKYIEASQIRHLAGFVLCAMICVLLFCAHVFEFSAYSLQSILSTQNLDILSENMDASDKDKEIVIDILEDYSCEVADRVADLLVLNKDICSHEELTRIADNVCMNEISVYDGKGILQASSGDYYGYELTTNEADSLYAARKVLTDDADYVFIDPDDESGRYILAQRRKDTPGIICLEYTNPKLTEMLKYYSKEEAIKDTDFGNATTFFVKVDDNRSTYVVEPYSSEIESSQVEIPEQLDQDNFSGIAEIGGIRSYVNTKKGGEILIVSTIDAKSLNSMLASNLLVLSGSFVLFFLLLLYGCICVPEVIEGEQEESDQTEPEVVYTRSKESLFSDNCFRKILKREFIILIIGYCFLMFKKTANEQTLLKFVFEGKWDKGINLFSINASIIIGVVIVLVMFLTKKILTFVGRSIGAKGITVCSIIISLLQFLSLFFIILHTLYQFGVDTSALIASAGITGLTIGIAAKDVVGDLISGLFLIFEGNIKVGDFVKFKDFRGEVSEIGARVTVIKRYNNKLIVNNSDLKQYYRLSDEPGAAWIEVAIGANEDIEKVKALIKSSEEWYQSRIPTLKAGPWFLNVTDFNSSGITIALCGSCIEERSGSTRRRLMFYTIELFRENGVTLAMDSMSIGVHNEDK